MRLRVSFSLRRAASQHREGGEMLKIGNAPVSWGVFESDDSANPSWEVVLDEIAGAGYRRTELGPVGFLPDDPAVLRRALDQRGLTLAGGFVYEHLHDDGARADVLETTRRVAHILAELGAAYLVVIDRMVAERQGTAGRPARALRLDDETWRDMITTIGAIADVAAGEFGLRPVLHPHCGTHLEFADEVDRALTELSASTIGLCLDTGHAAVAGMEAAELVHRYGARVEYLHLKDVSEAALARMRKSDMTFDEALGIGLFCPLGHGMVDFERLRTALAEASYDGIATVEQDPNPGASRPSGLAGATESLRFLNSVGLANR